MKPALLAAGLAAAFTLGRHIGEATGYHRAQMDHAGELVEAWNEGADAVRENFAALGASRRVALAHRSAQRRNAQRGLQ